MSFIKKKIPASAMQFAILVSVILGVLLASFLTLSHTQKLFSIQSNNVSQTIFANNLIIENALQNNDQIKDSLLTHYSGIETGKITAIVSKKFWGGFQLYESISKIAPISYKKKALVGAKKKLPHIGVYISDNKIPLILAGNTEIKGMAYVSEKGIKAGNISGHYFTGDKLVNGNIIYNDKNLPKLNNKWEKYIKNLLNYVPDNLDNVIEPKNVNAVSFFSNTAYIFSYNKLDVINKYVGNIIICSKTEIIVSPNAKLEDVILVAPKIIIKKGFRGNATFIANDKIIVEKNVILNYPSALVVRKKTTPVVSNNKIDKSIVVKPNTQISGIIIFLSNKNNLQNKQKTYISIDIQKNALIYGDVYCTNNLQLFGKIEGSVYTKRFISNTYGSIYINHLFNATIDGISQNKEFCGLPLINNNQGIVKWLY
jgi:hypothetical protein